MKKLLSVLGALCLSLVARAGAAGYDNLDVGKPGVADKVVEREGYALGYSAKYKQALWVQYRLTKSEVLKRRASRLEGFQEDPEVKDGPRLEDYAGSGYDRGHLAPAADMHWSESAMADSFYLSNISPQVADFNRGVWMALEQAVRRFAYSEDAVWVATGPVFKGWNGKTIGAGKVAVPPAYYKVVYSEKGNKMIGFVLKNEAGDKNNLKPYACSVREVERVTGLRFFARAPSLLKQSFDPSAWVWTEDRKAARRK